MALLLQNKPREARHCCYTFQNLVMDSGRTNITWNREMCMQCSWEEERNHQNQKTTVFSRCCIFCIKLG